MLTEMEEAGIHSAQKINCSDVFPLFHQQVGEQTKQTCCGKFHPNPRPLNPMMSDEET